MCGIALMLAGATIRRPDGESPPPPSLDDANKEIFLSISDIMSCLRRRGPDCLDCKKIFLRRDSHGTHTQGMDSCLLSSESMIVAIDPDDVGSFANECSVELNFVGATLQLRGTTPISQPLADTSGNLLVYNGETFGGVQIDFDKNDGEFLLEVLQSCSCDCLGKYCNCIQRRAYVVDILSSIRGPWSLIYWQAKSKTIWFGKDAFGRRSLLVHWPTFEDPQFILSSVSPNVSPPSSSGSTSSKDLKDDIYWEELPCGMYSLCFGTSKSTDLCDRPGIIGEVRLHEWTDPLLKKLTQWDRAHVNPNLDLDDSAVPLTAENISYLPHFDKVFANAYERHSPSACKLLAALRESVMRRTILRSNHQAIHGCRETEAAPVAVLFSGGLDSMILAALLDECLDPIYTIDLLNVSFDGMHAPDRISSREGLRELRNISPARRWRLVEIDAELLNLTLETEHIMSIINPAKTYMDLNIGIALWLAARGEGFVDEAVANHEQEGFRYKYISKARILLVGSGADEQCAGYGRHRTKYKLGSWAALQEEMKLDMQRIWKRNLGRDDRCLSDHGKEARFPFLDENVIEILLEMPLWEVADLNEPVGYGDKKILREVARLLGLNGAAALPKRAIQFGSRIARESNKQNFGSNRAANQASAGSVVVGMPSNQILNQHIPSWFTGNLNISKKYA